jgi:hypothetical protein
LTPSRTQLTRGPPTQRIRKPLQCAPPAGPDPYERVQRVGLQYVGTRFHAFDGGCLPLVFIAVFNGRSEPRRAPVHLLGVAGRDQLRPHVREESVGRLGLDPPGDGAP